MTDRLSIYNGALLCCEERALGSLTEVREPRYLLDTVWNNGGVQYCLEQGQWRFAMRTTKQTYDPDYDPAFGYRYAFPKPTDWVDTSAVCQDEYFQVPLLQYADEIGYWFADQEDIYIKYVSNDASFGMDLALWPMSFTRWVEYYFAGRIVGKLTGKEGLRKRLLGPVGRPDRGEVHAALTIAKNRDAMAGPTTFPARGSWASSRQGGRGYSRDGGNPGSLTG